MPRVMIQKIKRSITQIPQVIMSLQDVRVLGLAVFLLITLMISWSGVRVIETNYGLQKEISRLEQENAIQKLKNSNLALENDYYETDEYLELEARRNFGLAAPGETVIVVPKSVALKYVGGSTETSDQPASRTEESLTPQYQQNVTAWLDFLLRRDSSE